MRFCLAQSELCRFLGQKLSPWTRKYIAFFPSATHLTHTDEGFIGGVATAEFICCINLMEKIGGLSHKFA